MKRRTRSPERLALIGLMVLACSAPAPAPTPTAIAPTLAPTTSEPPSVTALATPVVAAPTATRVPVTRGSLTQATQGSLSRTLHPYPDSASYTQAWIDTAALIWGAADGSGALLAFDWNTLDFKPAMATALPTVSPDGKTFTFTLRDDLKWSDGVPIGAEDFRFAFDQASRDENRYVQLELVQDIAAFRTPDARTIEIGLKEARPREVAFGIVNVITPVPRHVWDGRPWLDVSGNPEILNPSVVLGPFKVEDFRPSERAAFVPVETYPGGKVQVPRVEILANQPSTTAFETLKSGRANWVHALGPSLYQEARSNPKLDVKEWTPANAAYRTLEFNVTRPFLSDKRVRQALAQAVSRTELIALAEQGLAVPQYSFVQPTNARWVNDALAHYDLDLAIARALLAAAGYTLRDGRLSGRDGQPVKLQVVFPTSSAPRAAIADYLQRQYRQLGFSVDIQGLDFNAYTDAVQLRHDFDISLAAYGGGSLDPDLGPRLQLVTNGPQNVTGYANPQVDELFRQAGVTLDSTRRKQLYDQIQVMVNADVPSHYLYALKSVDVFARSVHGVSPRRGDRLDANDALLSWSVDP